MTCDDKTEVQTVTLPGLAEKHDTRKPRHITLHAVFLLAILMQMSCGCRCSVCLSNFDTPIVVPLSPGAGAQHRGSCQCSLCVCFNNL